MPTELGPIVDVSRRCLVLLTEEVAGLRVLKAHLFSRLSFLADYFATRSQSHETAVIEPSSHMNIHDKFSLLFCPLSQLLLFFSLLPPRDLSCCV